MIVRSAVAANVCSAFSFSRVGPLLVLRGSSRGTCSSGPAPNAWPLDRLPSWARRSCFPWNTNCWKNNFWLVWVFFSFLFSLQFERVCVRDTLARGTPPAFRSWPRPRDAASATATLDFHFVLQNRRADNPRPFHFVFASPRGHPAVPYSARHVVARSSASARANNKEASPPGTYLIVLSGSKDRGFRWRGASSRRAHLIGLLARRTSSAGHSGDPSILVGKSFGFRL